MNLPDQIWRTAEAFQLPGTIGGVETHGEGLIHDTFVVSAGAKVNPERFILQRINQRVFTEPEALMGNIECVVSHLRTRAIESGRDPQRNVVNLIRTKTEKTWHESAGQAWRMLRYVEGTETIDRAPTVEQAREIGKTFGRFLDDLSDFPLELVRTVLPGYRDTERYLASLWHILEHDTFNRARDAREEIAFIKSRVDDTMRIQSLQRIGQVPLRVIHGDTKMSNVLLDTKTGTGICVIDLDTVMPGLLLHDIGDCARDALVGNRQHRESLSAHDRWIFEAIVAGFFSRLSTPPVALEIANIVAGVKSITLELGTRFLTDYLSGDVYFKTSHLRENLQRAGHHFHLFRMIEHCEGELQTIVQRCANEI
ncbi:phosphotransferase enzyme family protein [Candidatus Bipolaricaulota bacterium]